MQARGSDVQLLPAPALLGRRLAEKAWSLAYDNPNVTSFQSLSVARDMTTPEQGKSWAIIRQAVPQELCSKAVEELGDSATIHTTSSFEQLTPTPTCTRIAESIYEVRMGGTIQSFSNVSLEVQK